MKTQRMPNHVIKGKYTDEVRAMAVELLKDIVIPNHVDDYQIYMADQKHGWCCFEDRVIVIPRWCYFRPESGKGNRKLALKKKHLKDYWIYYLAHELAHAVTGGGNHDDNFMKAFINICPEELQYFELGYKPRNAKAAGISR